MDQDLAGATAFDLIAHWETVDALRDRVGHSAVPLILVEDAGQGAIAVGPLFRRGRPGCLACYIARRVAAGATELRPLAGPLPRKRLRPAIERVLDAERNGEVPVQLLVTTDGSHSTHRLLPLPDCRCHRDTGRSLARLPIEAAVDERLGIVQRVEIGNELWRGYTTARAWGAGYTTTAGDPVFNHGYAADISATRARVRAIGEALERYAAALGGHTPRACTPGEALSGPWPEQALPHADRLRWMPGVSLSRGQPVAVPARRVRLPYRPAPDEPRLRAVVSSTGLAAASDLSEAQTRGLLETIERDVFMHAWCLRPEMERLPPDAADPPGLHLVRLKHPARIPVVVAFLEDRAPPYVAAGLAARLTLSEARDAALREAVATRLWVEEWIARDPSIPPSPPHTLYEHAKLHALDPGLRAARTGWLAQAAPPTPPPVELDAASLYQAEPKAVAVELTTPDLSLLGCQVVRVVVPGCVPLDSDGRVPSLGGRAIPHPFA